MKDGIFPITFWVSGPTDQKRYIEMAKLRFTLVWGPDYWNAKFPSVSELERKNLAALDIAEKIGLKLIIFDSRIMSSQEGYHPPDSNMGKGWKRALRKAVKVYKKHPALWGYYVKDEPSAHHFPYLAERCNEILDEDPKHIPYINLFPIYAAPYQPGNTFDQLGTTSYTTYIEKYIQIVKPKIVSYDFYSYSKGCEPMPSEKYFANLEIVSKRTNEAKIPFFQVVQSVSELGDKGFRLPTPAEMRFQVYTTIAYGGKGVSYYTYWPRGKNSDGIISNSGKNSLCSVVKNINTELNKIGKIILGLTCCGVYCRDKKLPGKYIRKLSEKRNNVDIDHIMGEFKGKENLPYVIIVNCNTNMSSNPEIILRNNKKRVFIINKGSGKEEMLKARRKNGQDIYSYPIPPGDALILCLKN